MFHIVSATAHRRPSGAETARRTLRVVERLAAHGPIGLDALAQALGLNRSTVYRLLRVLQEEGWVVRLDGGGYRLGSTFRELAASSEPHAPTLPTLLPALQELCALAGETVGLYRRAGDLRVLVLGAEDERTSLRQVVRVGESFPLVRGCTGHAILAFLEPATARAIVERSCPPEQVGRVSARLRAIARRGYAISHGINHPGARGIAAPVRATAGGARTLCIGIAGPSERWTEKRARACLPDLLRTCETASQLLAGDAA
jgi:IclR family transcriptional regulator, acetate operon repressor